MVGRLNRDIPGSAGKTAACHSLIYGDNDLAP